MTFPELCLLQPEKGKIYLLTLARTQIQAFADAVLASKTHWRTAPRWRQRALANDTFRLDAWNTIIVICATRSSRASVSNLHTHMPFYTLYYPFLHHIHKLYRSITSCAMKHEFAVSPLQVKLGCKSKVSQQVHPPTSSFLCARLYNVHTQRDTWRYLCALTLSRKQTKILGMWFPCNLKTLPS